MVGKLDVHEAFRYNMIKLRRKQGHSYRSLADEVGCSGAYLYQIEEGLRNPTLAIMARIALALGVEVTRLLRPPHG